MDSYRRTDVIAGTRVIVDGVNSCAPIGHRFVHPPALLRMLYNHDPARRCATEPEHRMPIGWIEHDFTELKDGKLTSFPKALRLSLIYEAKNCALNQLL